MNETIEPDVDELAVFIAEGFPSHEFELFGKQIVIDPFPVGTRKLIERQISGLDLSARRYWQDVLDLAHALQRIGRYDFHGGKLDRKLAFIDALQDPTFELFVEEMRLAQQKIRLAIQNKRASLKKSVPNPG